MNKRAAGSLGEERAADFLRKNKVCILERNYRNRFGEIDIVAKDGNYLVFVEVKYRSNTHYGHPLEAVGFYKQTKIKKMAAFYLREKMYSVSTKVRFDCIGITGERIEWVKGAFY